MAYFTIESVHRLKWSQLSDAWREHSRLTLGSSSSLMPREHTVSHTWVGVLRQERGLSEGFRQRSILELRWSNWCNSHLLLWIGIRGDEPRLEVRGNLSLTPFGVTQQIGHTPTPHFLCNLLISSRYKSPSPSHPIPHLFFLLISHKNVLPYCDQDHNTQRIFLLRGELSPFSWAR